MLRSAIHSRPESIAVQSSASQSGATSESTQPSRLPSAETGLASYAALGLNGKQIEPQGTSGPQANQSQSVANSQDRNSSVVSVDLLVSELEAEGLLDSAAKAQLTDDLCRTPPHLWQGVVEAFRASLEVRKRKESARQYNPSEVFIEDNNVQGASYPSITSKSPSQNAQTAKSPPLSNQRQNSFLGNFEGANLAAFEEQSLSHTNREDVSRGDANGTRPTAQEPMSSAPSAGHGGASEGQRTEEVQREGVSQSEAASRFDASVTSNWDEQVKQAVQSLEGRSNRTLQEEIQLRLLHLVLTNREKSLEPIPGISPSLQDFWSQTLFGVLLLEDTQLHSDRQLRLLEARRHLENGVRRLGEECPLEVTGLAFVTSVQSWGVYEAFEQYEFSNGQKVLLYAEVENLASESTAKGYRTAWRSSYQILDATGKQVAQYEYPPNEEFCRRPRRDFFIGCELSIPKDAPPGRYTLRLTVVDLIKQRVGQGTVDFSVRSQPVR
ncbi:MAG: hypothetical protein ACUVQG_05775 [Thermogutta sp.]